MVHGVVLAIHISAGVSGLILGPAAMTAAVRGGLTTRAALAYQAAVGVLTGTAAVLAVLHWGRLWPFSVLAAATEGAAAAGWWTRDRVPATWLPWHVRFICGSYVSLVTALLVVAWGSIAAWVLPSVVGAALVEKAAHTVHTARAGRREPAAEVER